MAVTSSATPAYGPAPTTGLLGLLLGNQNPVAQWAGTHQNFLGALGAGIGSGPTIGAGLGAAAQMVPAARKADNGINQTIKFLTDKGDTDLIPLVTAGQGDVALQTSIQRHTPGYGKVPPVVVPAGSSVLDPLTYKPIAGTDATGGFAGTDLKAQAWNIILKGQSDPSIKSTPEYQTAVSIVSQPQQQMVQTPSGMMPISNPPVLPSFLGSQQPTVDPTAATPPSPQAGAVSAGGNSVAAGNVIPGTASPLTQNQSTDVYYATNAEGAIPVLDKLGGSLTSLAQKAGGKLLGDTLGNYVKSPEYQQAEQAGQLFINALERKESGAAIGATENATYGKTFLPQPGDKPQVLQQKTEARKRAVEALKAGMPPQAILALGQAVVTAPSLMPQDTSKPPVATKTINGTTYVQDANGDWFSQ